MFYSIQSFMINREMENREIASIQVYSSFFESGNQNDQNCNLEQQFHCLRQEGNMLNELNGNSFQQDPSMYPVSKAFHFPDQPVFAATDHHQTWVSDFGCSNQVFDLSDNNQVSAQINKLWYTQSKSNN